MLAHEINAKIAKQGCSLSMLAEALDVNQSSISLVIHRSSISKRLALAIAKTINTPIETVFPDVPQYHEGYSKKAQRAAKVNALREQLAS